MPHAEYTDLMYEAALACLENDIEEAHKRKELVIIGIDASAMFGEQSVHDSTRIIGQWGLHYKNLCGITLAAWMHINCMAAANTFFHKPFHKR